MDMAKLSQNSSSVTRRASTSSNTRVHFAEAQRHYDVLQWELKNMVQVSHHAEDFIALLPVNPDPQKSFSTDMASLQSLTHEFDEFSTLIDCRDHTSSPVQWFGGNKVVVDACFKLYQLKSVRDGHELLRLHDKHSFTAYDPSSLAGLCFALSMPFGFSSTSSTKGCASDYTAGKEKRTQDAPKSIIGVYGAIDDAGHPRYLSLMHIEFGAGERHAYILITELCLVRDNLRGLLRCREQAPMSGHAKLWALADWARPLRSTNRLRSSAPAPEDHTCHLSVQHAHAFLDARDLHSLSGCCRATLWACEATCWSRAVFIIDSVVGRSVESDCAFVPHTSDMRRTKPYQEGLKWKQQAFGGHWEISADTLCVLREKLYLLNEYLQLSPRLEDRLVTGIDIVCMYNKSAGSRIPNLAKHSIRAVGECHGLTHACVDVNIALMKTGAGLGALEEIEGHWRELEEIMARTVQESAIHLEESLTCKELSILEAAQDLCAERKVLAMLRHIWNFNCEDRALQQDPHFQGMKEGDLAHFLELENLFKDGRWHEFANPDATLFVELWGHIIKQVPKLLSAMDEGRTLIDGIDALAPDASTRRTRLLRFLSQKAAENRATTEAIEAQMRSSATELSKLISAGTLRLPDDFPNTPEAIISAMTQMGEGDSIGTYAKQIQNDVIKQGLLSKIEAVKQWFVVHNGAHAKYSRTSHRVGKKNISRSMAMLTTLLCRRSSKLR